MTEQSSAQPQVTLVVAMAKNRVIGNRGSMPWHLPADLQHFKRVTMGKPIIMGRKTYESIGRALPGRRNIVISRTDQPEQDNIEWCAGLDQALVNCAGLEEVMVIGGGVIYELALPLANRIWLTEVDFEPSGDTWFPQWNTKEWIELEKTVYNPDIKNRYKLTFRCLQRVHQSDKLTQIDHESGSVHSHQIKDDSTP